MSQEVSGRAGELEEIQDEDTSHSENTSEIPVEVEVFEPPQEEVVLICRSVRTHRAPKPLCLNVEVEEHSLGDLNEPINYKATMLEPESNKWLDAMNAEMQSMKDNQAWCLVDLPPNEAEYMAASEAAMEVVWIRKFISGLDPFTKSLLKGKLTQHARSIGLRLASSFI
ncbi:hypothetical protein Tco_0222658 [Tanacetum coccineum]